VTDANEARDTTTPEPALREAQTAHSTADGCEQALRTAPPS